MIEKHIIKEKLQGMDDMQNMRNRLSQLSEILRAHNSFNVNDLCAELSISVPTLKRYLVELSFYGWKTAIKNNTLTIQATGQIYDSKCLWKASDYTSWKIISFICLSGETTRSNLKTRFCSGFGENQLSERALDMHLRKLVMEGRLYREKKGRETCFYTKAREPIQLNSVQDIVNISVALENARHMFGDETTDRLKYWLEMTAADYLYKEKYTISKYGQAENISFYGYNPKTGIENEAFVRLNSLCKNKALISINTINNSRIQGIAFKCAYSHVQMGTWLFLFTGRGSSMYQVVRIDKAKAFNVLQESTELNDAERKEIQQLQMKLSKKLINAFGMGLDEEQEVELIFFPVAYVLDKADKMLEPVTIYKKKLDDGSYYFKCRIAGTGSFLHWLRKFGRSAMILSPEWLRNKHQESAYNVLNRYGEVYHESANNSY